MTKKICDIIGTKKTKLHNEDKLSIADISKTMGKSKIVIHSNLKELEETGSCEAKKPPGGPRKTTAREDRWISNESKKGSICDSNCYL